MSTQENDKNGEARAPRTESLSPQSTSRPAGRSWLWSFVGIFLIAFVLLGWLALFISQQFERQLTLEQLQAARKVWDAKGPKDYQMLYHVLRGDKSKDEFYAVVRGGKVQSVLFNNREQLPPEQMVDRSMDALLNDIEVFLKRDAQPGNPKSHCRASFASDDGHLIWFARRLPGGKEGVEIRVEEFRPLPVK